MAADPIRPSCARTAPRSAIGAARRSAVRATPLFGLLALTALALPACDEARASQPTRRHEVHVGGGRLSVVLERGALDLADDQLLAWVRDCARAVAAYYGRFPVAHARVIIRPRWGRGVHHGAAHGGHPPRVRVDIGRHTTVADLRDDWVLTHELVHLAFPDVDDPHHWLEEGLATYVEPISRLRTGVLSREKMWRDLVDGLPKGQPRPGDRGLDHTPTWGRTYWGGALFLFLADVRIRERTRNQKGLEDALRAIVARGGHLGVHWDIDRVLRVGDAATGVPVLRGLYDEMKARPVWVDLDGLWRRLGVIPVGRRVVFDEQAPLAAIRRAIDASRQADAASGPPGP